MLVSVASILSSSGSILTRRGSDESGGREAISRDPDGPAIGSNGECEGPVALILFGGGGDPGSSTDGERGPRSAAGASGCTETESSHTYQC